MILATVVRDSMMAVPLQKGMIYVCVCAHLRMYIMPIVAWPLLQVIPVNEMYVLTYGHDFKHLADFASLVPQMCLLNA